MRLRKEVFTISSRWQLPQSWQWNEPLEVFWKTQIELQISIIHMLLSKQCTYCIACHYCEGHMSLLVCKCHGDCELGSERMSETFFLWFQQQKSSPLVLHEGLNPWNALDILHWAPGGHIHSSIQLNGEYLLNKAWCWHMRTSQRIH